jgi:hypothetical protein
VLLFLFLCLICFVLILFRLLSLVRRLAEEALLHMVQLLGPEHYHVQINPGRFIIVTELIRVSSTTPPKRRNSASSSKGRGTPRDIAAPSRPTSAASATATASASASSAAPAAAPVAVQAEAVVDGKESPRGAPRSPSTGTDTGTTAGAVAGPGSRPSSPRAGSAPGSRAGSRPGSRPGSRASIRPDKDCTLGPGEDGTNQPREGQGEQQDERAGSGEGEEGGEEDEEGEEDDDDYDDDEYIERVIHLQCGNMFDVKNIDIADVVMMETDIPSEQYDRLQLLLEDMKEGAKILTYADLRKIWETSRHSFKQLEINRHHADRYSTSWSVHRGHHFYLWGKVCFFLLY